LVHVKRLTLLIAAIAVPLFGCDSRTEEPPAPDKGSETTRTCKHVVEVLSKNKAVEDEAVLTRIQADCEASLAELEDRHRSLTACMLAAGTKAEIEACEKPAQRYDSVLRGLGPSNEDVCAHVMDVLKREMGDAATQPNAEDTAKLMENCSRNMDKEKEKMGEQDFRTRSSCVMDAQTMEDMARCERKD
jgi:hypothetical protein